MRTPGSGRKAGTPNRDTSTAREVMQRLGCNPIEGMCKIAMDPDTRPELRGKMFAELAKYGYPQLKAIELSGIGGSAIEVNVGATEILLGRIAGIAARIGTPSGG